MSPTTLLLPTYKQMLRTLTGLLDKAEAQQPDRAEQLLSASIASDMYPLATQLRFAAFQAQEAVFRLLGEPVPEALLAVAAEARDAGDAPGSIADARVRIDQALAFLDTLPDDCLDESGTTPITIDAPGRGIFDLTGAEYVRDWALPQFYFHVLMAYAILRGEGVDIGKADYVPHMFAYLRPETGIPA
ncbi:DUF1993 domain-containing protein [Sphingomonas aliaeris]|uniref:DUF1993 domain-containing protein n=1 Tax=Sphingomonas aliaeris TaxID=2759526 RepID=A0A974NSY4_9SPHN|nr:DUF1993 domain-containing protein [Sphingomonas aliaeris]QQV76337.1 DUF1993 domain-containing protein [Sphingomonas aliaeris]